MPILRGAKSLLPRVRGVQLELSIEPLYVGQTLYLDTIKFLQLHGFTLWNVIPGFSDNVTGRMLQMDGTFFRTGGEQTQKRDASALGISKQRSSAAEASNGSTPRVLRW